MAAAVAAAVGKAAGETVAEAVVGAEGDRAHSPLLFAQAEEVAAEEVAAEEVGAEGATAEACTHMDVSEPLHSIEVRPVAVAADAPPSDLALRGWPMVTVQPLLTTEIIVAEPEPEPEPEPEAEPDRAKLVASSIVRAAVRSPDLQPCGNGGAGAADES